MRSYPGANVGNNYNLILVNLIETEGEMPLKQSMKSVSLGEASRPKQCRYLQGVNWW